MHAWLGLAIALTLHLTGTYEAHACERPRTPLSAKELAAIVADEIATVEVKAVKGGVATVVVTEAHAGGLAKNATIKIADILTIDEAAAGGFCGHASMTPGEKHLVLMWRPLGTARDYRLIDDVFGVARDLDPKPYKDARAKPLPHSAWKTSPSGTRAMIAKDPSAKTVDVVVVVRNGGTQAVDFTRKYFPLAEHTYCSLQITNATTKKPIAAKDAVPAAAGYGYFEKHGNAFTSKLEPGAGVMITLTRITTAQTGWGYKEDLGFKHYPVEKPGAHTIAADCVNFFGPKSSFSTDAMTMTL
ncbi:MAG: hypothetical protein IPQ07_24540 [Myxococcales bacterium]|nr:hypothetical protein [Myxococcales bacterium]